MQSDAHLLFMRLVPNVRCYIITFLPWRDLISITGTCKELRKYLNAEYLWKQHFTHKQYNPRYQNPIRQCVMEHRMLSNYYNAKYYIYELIGHSDTITSIDCINQNIITATKAGAVRLWDMGKQLIRLPFEM